MAYDERIKVGQLCQRCGEQCVAFFQGEVAACFWALWPGGREQIGHVPPDDICGVRAGGDRNFMNLNLCLACGTVQGEWPKKSVKKWLADRPLKRFEFAVLRTGGTWEGEHWVNAQDAGQARKSLLRQLEDARIDVVELVLLLDAGPEEEEE